MKETGRRLIRHGKISLDTLNTISRNLLSKEQYLMVVNQLIKNILSQHGNWRYSIMYYSIINVDLTIF